MFFYNTSVYIFLNIRQKSVGLHRTITCKTVQHHVIKWFSASMGINQSFYSLKDQTYRPDLAHPKTILASLLWLKGYLCPQNMGIIAQSISPLFEFDQEYLYLFIYIFLYQFYQFLNSIYFILSIFRLFCKLKLLSAAFEKKTWTGGEKRF